MNKSQIKLKEFTDTLLELDKQIDFKISARGWCYQLEVEGIITKDEFDRTQGKINKCIKLGLLPIDFVAENAGHKWNGVEIPENETKEDYLEWYIKREIKNAFYYNPDWWIEEEYYIQMVVEKIDLITLFKPICDLFHIPITNAKGWGSMLQRAEMGQRFKQAEEKGLKCVLLYCGDHDPDGLRIGNNYRNMLNSIKDSWFRDGNLGYNPKNLIIDRFGLNGKWINKNKLTWIDNLITGSGKNLSDPKHKNYNQPYVQEYLGEWGIRKCEANALIVISEKARQLCRDAIEKYLGEDAEERFIDIKEENKSEMDNIFKKLKEGNNW